MAPTVYEYDSLGNQTRSGMDLNGTVGLQTAAVPPEPPGQHADRIQDTDTVYERDGSQN